MSFSPDQTRAWLDRLQAAGIDEASQDLRHIILSAKDADAVEAMVARRAAREPLSHILGDKPFWTLDLKVTPDVLTPRADTETLVEAVLKRIEDKQAVLRIADFGTGSGAILLALLSELPNATGLGIDISESALAVASENARRNDLASRAEFRVGNWADGITDERFDIVVSNPPYIVSDVLETLEPEVKDFEPHAALDGGADGLDAYRLLFPEFFRILKYGGLAAVEIGYDQSDPMIALAARAGFAAPKLEKDLGGHDRVIWDRKRES